MCCYESPSLVCFALERPPAGVILFGKGKRLGCFVSPHNAAQ